MTRVFGFALFCIAIGIVIGNLITVKWCDCISVMICCLSGYILFFHC